MPCSFPHVVAREFCFWWGKLLRLASAIRAEAAAVLLCLRRLGYRPEMTPGDSPRRCTPGHARAYGVWVGAVLDCFLKGGVVVFGDVYVQMLFEAYWCFFVLQLLLMQRFSKC